MVGFIPMNIDISVIIPFYNRSAYLEKAVESVRNQSAFLIGKFHWEMILVDDGSTDEGYTGELRGNESLIRTENRGVSAARNIGVSEALGYWIMLLDSDDAWEPEKVEWQMRYHKENPNSKISQTEEIWIRNGKFVNPHTKHRKKDGWIFRESLSQCMVTPSSVCIERSLWTSLGGMDERLPACEDYDLWLAISARLPISLIAQKALTRYAGHKDQLSGKFNVMDRFRIYSLIQRKNLFSEEQRILAKAVLQEKLKILIQGKTKRKKDTKELCDLLEWVVGSYENSHSRLEDKWKDFLLNSENWN